MGAEIIDIIGMIVIFIVQVIYIYSLLFFRVLKRAMAIQKTRRRTRLLINMRWGSILFLLFLITSSQSGKAIKADSFPIQTNLDSSETFNFDNSIFLPVILKYAPLAMPIFGVETNRIYDPVILDKASTADVYWMRGPKVSWEEIEPIRVSPPSYDWSSINGQDIADTSARGFKIIATIKFTPGWAQKYPGVSCGPIAESQFNAFAEFLHELVTIYGAEPYNVKYWEIGNEPDVDHRIPGIVPDSGFGCWGEESDAYYGGGYYAKMLKVAYPAIKNADPEAKVMLGGLLLDCDPTNPPAGKDCKSSKFLQGILVGGGGNYFDIVSYHGYPFYQKYQVPGKQPQYLYYDEHHPYWEARGGIVLGKANFLKEVMAPYGLSKPLMPTEASLTCKETTPGCYPIGDSFLQAQADFVAWLFVRNWASGFLGTTWYTLEGPGWRNVGLLNEDNSPRPAYHALNFITQELSNTIYKGQVTLYPNLRGYEFGNDQKRIWVLWAPDEQPYSINLPAGVLKVLDKYGNLITPQAGIITVKSPVYLEFNP